jgi:hypothetical protein
MDDSEKRYHISTITGKVGAMLLRLQERAEIRREGAGRDGMQTNIGMRRDEEIFVGYNYIISCIYRHELLA